LFGAGPITFRKGTRRSGCVALLRNETPGQTGKEEKYCSGMLCRRLPQSTGRLQHCPARQDEKVWRAVKADMVLKMAPEKIGLSKRLQDGRENT
jgi:hypothetical protein